MRENTDAGRAWNTSEGALYDWIGDYARESGMIPEAADHVDVLVLVRAESLGAEEDGAVPVEITQGWCTPGEARLSRDTHLAMACDHLDSLRQRDGAHESTTRGWSQADELHG